MKKIFKYIGSLFIGSKAKQDADSQVVTEGQAIRAIVVTDLGNVRKNNEDTAYFVRPNDPKVRESKGYLGIVADGMGGHAAGEVASKMAVEQIRKSYYESQGNIEAGLKAAFELANRKINQKAQSDQSKKGMGTTATAVVILNNELYCAHVGDSRLYHLSKTGIKQLSNDHTYIQELLRKGEISPEKAAVHPERNVLTRAMGTQKNVEVDVAKIKAPFEVGERLLLCSDGLYDYLNDQEIYKTAAEGELKSCAYELVNTAKQRGGHDNITVMIIEAIGEDKSIETKVTMDLDDLVRNSESVTKEIDIN